MTKKIVPAVTDPAEIAKYVETYTPIPTIEQEEAAISRRAADILIFGTAGKGGVFDAHYALMRAHFERVD